MLNNNTYYGVKLVYPAVINTWVNIPGEITTADFVSRATTMADLYIDVWRYSLELHTRFHEDPDVQNGERQLTFAELQSLPLATIKRCVEIVNYEIVHALDTALTLIDDLDCSLKALPGLSTQNLMNRTLGDAANSKWLLSVSVNNLLRYCAWDLPDATFDNGTHTQPMFVDGTLRALLSDIGTAEITLTNLRQNQLS